MRNFSFRTNSISFLFHYLNQLRLLDCFSCRYHRNSVPNEKTDVYSFGIVLLELISSRPAIIKITEDNRCNITYWVRPIIAKGDIRMIVDPRLQGKFETNSARRAIETAMSCVSLSSTDRPTMSDIIVELRECLKIVMTHERTKEGHASVGIEAAMTVQERYKYLSKIGTYSL